MNPESCAFYDVPCGANWLVIQLESFFIWVWQSTLDLSASFVELIPVPDFLINISPVSIPSGVIFMLEPFALQSGITIMVSAYIARFLVRRLPIIG
jgi:hypothetical protein